MKVLSVRPGITDPASIKYRNENDILSSASNPEEYYIQHIMPDKLKINIDYINKRTFVKDIKIIFQTIFG
jgi:lipopolysaccharide/colanic/teichoic acid biosynthesis glycosyltransferase